MNFYYQPLLRPASFSTLPAGLKWEYLERPSYVSGSARPDLRLSQYPHGVIAVDRELTKEECFHFDLKRTFF